MDTLHIILDLMWKKGISDAELCKLAGINKSAVTDWKKGKTKSYMKHIDKIASVLNVPVEYLMGGTSAPTQEQKDELMRLTEQMSPDEQQKVKEYMEFLISQRKTKDE